ncbi:hypothetical protein SDRG_01570 [Saprolegnia diclina VS20]|uniref:Uncharacterized protein n=1 Tax=Saprolegnia diclina (strain VS20) TaxID=1156394 RepID=T0R3R6_SAPDV|nr:hypothetical protein SDRG_01570 [Saprolegnia diclina VS20]EQC41611.1 hypothetical protein SDRG_01570 [Saprolegnia diclina VS20]|eukprot:XP_008605325.1 hypothetical protein SDRG_01570 [Saprolegnia diclina VS20]
MSADKLLADVLGEDLPRFLKQVQALQEKHASTTAALHKRDARVHELENQVAGLQNDYLAISMDTTSREHANQRQLLLSCVQATTYALAHGHQLNPMTQVPVLHAMDSFLQDMLDSDADPMTLKCIASTLGSVLHDPACLLLPSILAAVESIFIKLTLLTVMIPCSMLQELVPIFGLMASSSRGTSVLVGCNLVVPLLKIIASDGLCDTIAPSVYAALLALLQHLLQHTKYHALKQQRHDATFHFFKVITSSRDRSVLDLARRMHEEFRRSQA